MTVKAAVFFLALVFATDASYIVHLSYDNGAVAQVAVYYADAVPVEQGLEGEYVVSVGNYSANLSFPLVTVYDPEDIFINGSKRLAPINEIFTADEKVDGFVVVPEVLPGAMLRVANGSEVVLEEPLMLPVALDAVVPAEDGGHECKDDSECGRGFFCSGGQCVEGAGPVCGPAFMFPMLLVFGILWVGGKGL